MPIDISLVSSNVVITEVSGHKKGWKPMSASYEFDANSNLLLTINGQTRSIPLTDLTVSSVAPANANAAITALAAVFLNAGGAATSTFTALSGTAWDGTNKYTTLTANTALTLSVGSNVSGILNVYQDATGSRTLSINGVPFTINTAANSVTGIGYYVTNGVVNFTVDTSLIQYTPDVTAPTMVSAMAVSGSTVEGTMSESVSGSVAGWSMKQNGVVIYPDSVSGTTVRSLVFSESLLSTDTLLISYDSVLGDTIDAAGNKLASFTDVVVTYKATIAGTAWYTRKDPSIGATTSGTSPVLITGLNDLSGNNHPWTVPGGTAPEYQVNGFGTGKAAIKLDTNKSLGTTTFATALAKPYTRIAVVKFNTMPAAGIGKYFFYSNSPSAESNASIVGTGGNLSMWSGTGAPLVATAALALNTTYVIWLEYVGGSNDKIYVNNTLKITGNAGNHLNITGERIGEVGGASADCLMGDVMMYAGIMSATDRTSIYNELAAKYGI